MPNRTTLLPLLLTASLYPCATVRAETARASTVPTRMLHGQTPESVARGQAVAHGAVAPGTPLTLAVSLGMHDPAALDARIAAAATT